MFRNNPLCRFVYNIHPSWSGSWMAGWTSFNSPINFHEHAQLDGSRDESPSSSHEPTPEQKSKSAKFTRWSLCSSFSCSMVAHKLYNLEVLCSHAAKYWAFIYLCILSIWRLLTRLQRSLNCLKMLDAWDETGLICTELAESLTF